MDIPSVNQRIKFIIDSFFDGSENAFAKAVEVSQGTINRLFRVDVRYGVIPEASSNTISKVINNLIGVDELWLINGTGELPKKVLIKSEFKNLVKKNQESLNNLNESEKLTNVINNGNGGRIPFYDIDFSSGFEMVVNDQTVNPSYYFYHPDFDKAEFAVRNSGKSMSNIIGPHDIIGMRRVENWKDYFPEGEVYGLVTSNDMRTIKHVKKDKENNALILIPDPKDEFKHLYPEQEELPIKMVLNFYQVVAAMDVKKLSF